MIGWRAILLSILLAISVWDVRTRRIPDVLTGLLLMADWLCLALTVPEVADILPRFAFGIGRGLIALFAGLAIDAVAVKLMRSHPIGGGDIKLIAAFAAMPSCASLLAVLFSASLSAVLFALLRRKGMRDRIPFGPFLALGFALSSVVFPALV